MRRRKKPATDSFHRGLGKRKAVSVTEGEGGGETSQKEKKTKA